MKILHITNRLSEGGVESFLLQLLPKLRQNGLKVELLVLDKHASSLSSAFTEKGIKVHISHCGSLYNPMQIFEIRKYLPAFDIVHVHLWPTQLYVSIAKTIIKSTVKLITTEHTNFNKRRTYLFYRPVERWMYGKYHMIVGCGVAACNNLVKWIGRNDRIISISNGIDIQKYTRTQKVYGSKENLGLPSNAYVIVMVARFFSQKDHATLIRALLHLPENVCVLFVGSGPTMPQCKTLARDSGLVKRVYFLGKRTDVAEILQISDICVLSTHYEGLSISVIEYMASGKPVIASDVDGMSELIKDKNLLFPVGDSLELAKKILMLMDNPKYAKAKAIENRDHAQNYSIETMVSHYMDIYISM